MKKSMRWVALSTIGIASLAMTGAGALAGQIDHRQGWQRGDRNDHGFGQIEQIARKAERLAMAVRSNPQLSDALLQRIDGLLDRALEIANGEPMPGPGPGPMPGPIQPDRPACVLQGAGVYNYTSYNFLISVGGNVLDGENDLNSALNKIDTLRSAGVCSSAPSMQNTCGLQGAGVYNYTSYNFQVQLNGTTLQGENDVSSALSDISRLSEHGLCRVQSEGSCNLGGAGVYNYTSYNYLLSIGQTVIDGNNDMSSVLNEMGALRNAGICN